MSWGSHPDTIVSAYAADQADMAVADRTSLVWTKAYRDAYAKRLEGDDSPSAARFIAELDETIARREGGWTIEQLAREKTDYLRKIGYLKPLDS